MVKAGHLGIKSGQGFYHYDKGKAVRRAPGKDYRAPDDLTDRLILSMLNEAVACLRENVVGESELIDAGAVFGTGFAPFRGGPMHYIEAKGAPGFLSTLERLEAQHGSRFGADVGWNRLAVQE